MILVIAGTQDGRELAGFLLNKGYQVTASVISQYGRKLAEQYPGIKVNDKMLDENELRDYLLANDIKVLVDASHPYAANVSVNSMKACHLAEVPYIRYERSAIEFTYDKVFSVYSYDDAAKKASELGNTVFLTTGSRNVKTFVKAPSLIGHRIVARILPTADVIAEVTELGLTPKDIVALQGPFTKEFNLVMFKEYGAEVIVSKNSGIVGGADTKFEAAKELGLPIVLIEKPEIAYDKKAESFAEVADFIKNNLN